MKVLCVISARGGSKGVPKKNLRKLKDLPLISYSFIKAKSTKLIDKVICSTESEEIAEIARSYEVEVPFLRPKNLADDNTSLIAVTKHAMLEMDSLDQKYDVILQLSPTCPFIKIKSIEKSILYCSEGNSDSAVSLKKIEHEHPYRARELDSEYFFDNFIKDINVEAKQFHSRQDLPILYCTSGGIYTRKRKLLENFNGEDFAMGKKRKAVVLDDFESINIDRIIDFDFAEFLINSNKLDSKHLI